MGIYFQSKKTGTTHGYTSSSSLVLPVPAVLSHNLTSGAIVINQSIGCGACGFISRSLNTGVSTVWVKKSRLHWSFLTFFHKRLGIFTQFFTHLLHVPIYAWLQIFIQLFPILTKLYHIERDYLVHIICSKCPPSAKTHAFRCLRKSLIAWWSLSVVNHPTHLTDCAFITRMLYKDVY